MKRWALFIMGSVLIFLMFILLSAYLSITGFSPSTAWAAFLVMVFIGVPLVAVIVIIFGRRSEGPPAPTPTYTPPPTPRDVIREEITKKEVIVKIRCSYCGTLFDETLDKCPHCGAKK